MTTIRLEPFHIEFADKIGWRRRQVAIDRDRVGDNGAPEGWGGLAIDVLGARCEAAGKLYLNPVKWNALADNIKGLADLEDWIDVKGVSLSRYRLVVQKDDREDWAYLLVNAERHPDYEIVGWCYGHEAKKQKYWSDPKGGRPAYFVPRNDQIIMTPESLFAEVRRRQTKAA